MPPDPRPPVPDPRLSPVAPDVWQIAHTVRLPGGVVLPANCTVVRLPDGRLLLHSPTPLDDALAAALEALGPVGHLVAPNALHHLWIVDASRRWPRARVHAAARVARKQPALRIDAPLADGAPAEWGGALECVVVGGAPFISEVVFFHRPSATLITVDLVFHVTAPANWATRLLLALAGTGRRLDQGREWRLLRRDRAAVRDAAARILAWPVARITMAHGAPYTGPDAHAALARALRRMAA